MTDNNMPDMDIDTYLQVYQDMQSYVSKLFLISCNGHSITLSIGLLNTDTYNPMH